MNKISGEFAPWEVEFYFMGALESFRVITYKRQRKKIVESFHRLTRYFVTEMRIDDGTKLSPIRFLQIVQL